MWKAQTQCFKKSICHTVLQQCDWDITLLGIVQPQFYKSMPLLHASTLKIIKIPETSTKGILHVLKQWIS